MHKWKLQFLMVLSCPDSLASAPSRGFQGTIYDICRDNIHPDFSATWRLHTKDEEATRFLSHIHQENYKLLVFCVKIQTVPLFILISVTLDLCIRMTYQILFIFHFDGIVGEKIVPAICTHGSVRRWMC